MSAGSRRKKRQRHGPVLSAHYKMRHRVPKVDCDVNPFCVERQLDDQAVQINRNKNPRRYELSHGDKVRSKEFQINKTKYEEDLDVFKYRVLTQALMDIEEGAGDGRVRKALRPPQVRETGWMFADSDITTTTSFGHRPSSASRTFNPLAMKAEPLQQHRDSKKKVFMTTTVLYNLLHPPPPPPVEAMSASCLSLLSTTAHITRRGGAEGGEQEQEEEGGRRTTEGPEVDTPPEEVTNPQESGWDSKFHLCQRKFFSDVTSLEAGANHSSVEKLTRFHKKSAGIDIPELYKDRITRDLLNASEVSGTFFPRREPKLIGKAPQTPRTIKCNQLIKRIFAKEQEKRERLDEKVRKYELRNELARIPKLPPIRI